MLKKFILKLRHKPKPVRDRVALLGATVFTSIIFVVWLYHAPARHAAIEARNLDSVANQSPGFSELFSTLGETMSSIKEAVGAASSSDSLETSSVENSVDNPSSKDEVVVLKERTSTTSSLGERSTTTSLKRATTTSDDLGSLFKFEGFEQYYDEESASAQEVRIMTSPIASTSESKDVEATP